MRFQCSEGQASALEHEGDSEEAAGLQHDGDDAVQGEVDS